MPEKPDVAVAGYSGTLMQVGRLLDHHLDLFFNKGVLNTVVPYIEGPPGIGKTDLVNELAKKYNVGFRDLPLIIWDQVDFRGIPHVKDGQTHWAMPSDLPRDGRGILFLDEFKQSYQAIQNCASRLILARQLGEYKVPDGWFIMLASNGDTDKAATHKMASFLNNRLAHYKVSVNFEEWRSWAARNSVDHRIIGFLSFASNFLHQFDPDMPAFPSPRSWAATSRLLQDARDDDIGAFVSANVGMAVATQFITFLSNTKSLSTFEEIIANPEGLALPANSASNYAAAAMIGTRVSKKTASQAWRYVGRMQEEFAFLAFYIVMARPEFPELATDPVIRKWAETRPQLFMS